ncbi:serine hydrolase domain-containing protein [Pontibacter harenae]|uniref:serine hydrolase domain-containing protein n=1 Tax=Pontibacter harenae TaxID=2894083 RepID=UPI001E4B623E|nr:serine hydrolase [Pontibacter harenae]MCC9166660.1 beta-lactamase family protein [Pontibacter harenae]
MSKRAKRFAFGTLLVLGLLAAWIHLADKNYVYKAAYYNFPDIDDNLIFHQRKIEAGTSPEPWPISSNYNKLQFPESLAQLHQELETVAFLVIKNDSIVYEQYWDGYSDESLSNSFSMAKSIISALVGVAIQEGKIKSVEQPVGDFLPEYKEGAKAKIKLRHLLWMSSGLDWDESYSNPFSVTTEAYYGDNLKRIIDRLEATEDPGQAFEYKSGDTQLLSFVLEAATGKSVSAYAEEKLWKKIGSVHNAEWSLDRPAGNEKAYCCFFSNARDFARLGRLYLNNGIWNNDTIVPPAYVKASLKGSMIPKASNGKPTDFYGYQWWLLPDYKGQEIFYARGILGQYIVAIPEKNIIFVRLGEKRGERKGEHPGEVLAMIDAVNEVVK